MSKEVQRSDAEQRAVDGFDGFEDGMEGSDEQQLNSRHIQGQLIKFTLDYRWVTKDGDELPKTNLLAIDILRVVQRWGKDKTQGPLEERLLGPGEKFPDFDKLNEAIPRSEWLEGFNGQPRGPWQGAFFVHLFEENKVEKYTFIANLTTIGACIAVRELAEKVQWKRRFRGESVYAVVRLSDTYMHTRFGGRQRAHFDVKCWITFGPSGEVKQLEAPTQQKLEQSTGEQGGVKPVAPVTAKEATGDEIQF